MNVSDIAGIVVLYRPDEKAIDNLKQSAAIFKSLYVIDNTENEQKTFKISELLHNNKNVKINSLGENLGIGAALNIGLAKALADGYDWVVTLDQDSLIDFQTINQMKDLARKESKVGIISPVHMQNGIIIERNAIGKNKCFSVDAAMMSGNLLSIRAFLNAGGFREDLFIDYVDTEFCLRLKNKGYKVILCPNISLDHNLGNLKFSNIGGIIFKPTHHNSTRRYYITRNRIEVYKNYWFTNPYFVLEDILRFFKETIFIIFYEDKKLSKLTSVYFGFKDGLSNRLGARSI